MKCRACYKWVPDDAKFCEHCGTGLTKEGPKLPHAHDGQQHRQHAEHKASDKPADPSAARAAIEKMRQLLTRPAPGAKEWAQKIVDRHQRGEQVTPHALTAAREALGQSPEQLALRAVEDELKARGPIRVPGQDDEEPQAHAVGR